MSILSRVLNLFRLGAPTEEPANHQRPLTDDERASRVAAFLELPEAEQLARWQELAQLINDDE